MTSQKVLHHTTNALSNVHVSDITTADATEAIFGTMTFFQFDKILAGSCVVVACAVVFIHLLSHANRLSNPSEQVKYILLYFSLVDLRKLTIGRVGL